MLVPLPTPTPTIETVLSKSLEFVRNENSQSCPGPTIQSETLVIHALIGVPGDLEAG